MLVVVACPTTQRLRPIGGEESMRWFYLAVIVLVAVATLIFALQNFEIVTMSFLRFEVRAPLAVVTIVVYVLGAATGGAYWRYCGDPTTSHGRALYVLREQTAAGGRLSAASTL
jgi:lipopolysaccharide assembly protein A